MIRVIIILFSVFYLSCNDDKSEIIIDETFKNEIVVQKIKIDSFTYNVPTYLIQNKIPDNLSKNLIKASLNFTRNIIQNRFFLPNNLPFPKSRILLESYYS